MVMEDEEDFRIYGFLCYVDFFFFPIISVGVGVCSSNVLTGYTYSSYSIHGHPSSTHENR